MTAIVIDASVAAVWLMDDEPDDLADAAWRSSIELGAIVPQLWHLETRNMLAVNERRGRLSAEKTEECLELLKRLPVSTDTDLDLDAALILARNQLLTVYDAVYLELADRTSAALATLDARLARAAQSIGVALVR